MLYLFKENISLENVKEKYIETIKNDSRFTKEINEDLITIEEKYTKYCFYEGTIKDHIYFIKNKITNESINGTIDVSLAYSSKDFKLNGLKKSDSIIIDEFSSKVQNDKESKEDFKRFIDKINDKLEYLICQKHDIKPSRKIHLEISPIEKFSEYNETFYFEKIYEIHYRDSSKKGDYVSILSSVNLKFYKLEYVYSDEYHYYQELFRRPIVYIPSEYRTLYDIDGFKIFQSMKRKLQYNSEFDIYKKIKGNIDFYEYKQYKDYLYSGIYYFKIKKYLNRIIIDDEDIKRKIYLSFLTLHYNKDSGLFLYECGKSDMLPDNSETKLIKYLKISCLLGSMEAKKYLYEYYSSSLNFNESLKKRYS